MSKWHKGSRFWRVAPWVIVLSTGLSIYFQEPSVFVNVVVVVMGGAGAKSTVDQYNQRPRPPIRTALDQASGNAGGRPVDSDIPEAS